MAKPSDDVCLVIEMHGFCVDGRFQCRELGYCSWLGDAGRIAFQPSKEFRHLTPKEKKSVKHVQRRIHGMTYYADKREEIGVNPRRVIRELFDEFATDHRPRVAFKGGHLEKDVLTSLNLPYVDLETWGCPTYDELRLFYDEKLWDNCPWHAIPSSHHCAMAECQAFSLWYIRFLSLVSVVINTSAIEGKRSCMSSKRDVLYSAGGGGGTDFIIFFALYLALIASRSLT